MEFFETVTKRHCYRGAFTGAAVPRGDLETIVQAGLDAPSGCNAQTTRFVIVDDPAIAAKIQAMHPANKAMQQANAYIACIVDTQPAGVFEDLAFQVEDCAAAVQNMLLAITALGYASVWIDGWLRREGRAEAIGTWLGLPEGKIVRILLPVGVPAEAFNPPEKMPFAQRAWFNRYGQ
jgi:nitroreductase